jgi:hypothetical protein
MWKHFRRTFFSSGIDYVTNGNGCLVTPSEDHSDVRGSPILENAPFSDSVSVNYWISMPPKRSPLEFVLIRTVSSVRLRISELDAGTVLVMR